MYMPTANPQEEHDRLVTTLARDLERKGFRAVRADHIAGFEERRPQPLSFAASADAFVPDIVAEKDGKRFFFEVQSAQSMETDQALRKFQLLAGASEDPDTYLYIVVPRDEEEAARRFLTRIKLSHRQKVFVLPL